MVDEATQRKGDLGEQHACALKLDVVTPVAWKAQLPAVPTTDDLTPKAPLPPELMPAATVRLSHLSLWTAPEQPRISSAHQRSLVGAVLDCPGTVLGRHIQESTDVSPNYKGGGESHRALKNQREAARTGTNQVLARREAETRAEVHARALGKGPAVPSWMCPKTW